MRNPRAERCAGARGWLPGAALMLTALLLTAATAPAQPDSLSGDSTLLAARLVTAAIERTTHRVTYAPAYHRLPYPGGDLPDSLGVCTDLVVRVYRAVGVDLQREVHEDMRTAFAEYPDRWGLTQPDPSIDHRRVPNLRRFWERQGAELPVSHEAADYRPGDLVTWILWGYQPHVGIITDHRSIDDERPLVAHNIGAGPQLEDMLFDYPITGHYRYLPGGAD